MGELVTPVLLQHDSKCAHWRSNLHMATMAITLTPARHLVGVHSSIARATRKDPPAITGVSG